MTDSAFCRICVFNKVRITQTCVQYTAYYIRFDLFIEMRDEGWTGKELWDKFVEIYFVSSCFVAICYGIYLLSVWDRN